MGIGIYKTKEGFRAEGRKQDAIKNNKDTYTDAKGKTRYTKNDRWVSYSKINGHTVLQDVLNDTRFHRWNEFKDHKYCCCSTGNYDAKERSIRFYYRGIGTEKAPYARQLVYTADDRLLAGFGGKEIRFD